MRFAYRHYFLLVVTVLLLFNYVDRMALAILLQDIKIDLQLSDTQLGLLSGIAFAIFYSSMGIPIARWADRGNRVTIISLTAALWSVAVALCGMAGSFVQLLLIRIGVAVGEAGCIPPAFSLIADNFSRAERPRATAIYGMGAALSFVVGFFGAGWLNDLYGWRLTFMLLALPGLLLAVVAWFTLREPRNMKSTQSTGRSERLPTAAPSAPQPDLREVCVTLWASATFRHLVICLSVLYLFGYGILQWQPAFFIRSFGFTTAEVGTWLAVVYGLGGLTGTYLGGEWASRYAAQNERLQLQAMAAAIAISGVLSVLAYLSTNPYWAFAFIGLYVFAEYTMNGPLLATIQSIVPEHMRAVSIALVYLVANLIGMGLGPLAAGSLSDALQPWVGDESLRYALLILSPGYCWGAWHAWRGSKTVTRDLAAAQVEQDRSLTSPPLSSADPTASDARAVSAG